MQYPLLNITQEYWGDQFSEFFLLDEYINSKVNVSKFKNQISHSNEVFLSEDGYLYKVIGVESLGEWRRYIPFIKKYKLIFEKTDEKITLNEVRDFMIKHIEEDLANDNYNKKWINALKNSNTIGELFMTNGN